MTDPLERLIREGLADEAAAVEARGDGLALIRDRIEARRHRWFPRLAVATAAVAVLGVLAGTAVLARVLRPDPAPLPVATPSAVPSATPPAVPSATPSTTVTPGAGATVPVYYVGADSRLYREFHHSPPTGDPLRTAVTAMLAQPPEDPDYRGPWADGTAVTAVTRSGTTATVSVTIAPPTPVASAQLLYTATAADPQITAVVIRWPGGATAPLRREDVRWLAAVWVLAPTQGATVDRVFTLSGTASVFEGTVSWQLRRGTTVVASGVATTLGAPARGTWQVRVTAPAPGAYTVVAYEQSAKDGSLTAPDTKDLTVG
jgi:hypothetical protein